MSIIECKCHACRKDDPNGNGFIWESADGASWHKVYAIGQGQIKAVPINKS